MRWVTAEEVSKVAHLSPGTLANWRWKDLRAGRSGAAPGQPVYRRFGRAVRYLVDADGLPVMAEETNRRGMGCREEHNSRHCTARERGNKGRCSVGAEVDSMSPD